MSESGSSTSSFGSAKTSSGMSESSASSYSSSSGSGSDSTSMSGGSGSDFGSGSGSGSDSGSSGQTGWAIVDVRWHMDTGEGDVSWGIFGVRNYGPETISIFEVDTDVPGRIEITDVFGAEILPGEQLAVEFESTIDGQSFEGYELYISVHIGANDETQAAIWPAATE